MDAPAALPDRLKLATRELHARAERSGIMADMLARTISRDAYVALLANLHAIYAALEGALDNAARPMRFASLARTAALAGDLQALGGGSIVDLAPATRDYVERLRSLHGPQAHRLWAHVYVRYLGDLHGGQMMSRVVRDVVAPVAATRFYEFGSADEVRALRASLRHDLASLALGAARIDEVVAEAVWAFEAHCALFEQLRAPTGRSKALGSHSGDSAPE